MTQGAKVCCPFRAQHNRKHGIIAKKGWQIVFRPEGATYISPTATPWVIME